MTYQGRRYRLRKPLKMVCEAVVISVVAVVITFGLLFGMSEQHHRRAESFNEVIVNGQK